MPITPTFQHEMQYWNECIPHIAGVDEAGMGALAGPVVAAAVIFTQEQCAIPDSIVIRDSKTMSAKQREKASLWIQNNVYSWSIACANVDEITARNIRGASHLAIQKAADTLSCAPDLLLIDGSPAQPHPHIPTVNIIDGDALSYSIAAASILAKVHRDAIMKSLDEVFPAYGFSSHKGYGTAVHLSALQEHGACPHHRATYGPVKKILDSHS